MSSLTDHYSQNIMDLGEDTRLALLGRELIHSGQLAPFRKKIGMTQQEFAIAAGINIGTLHRWEQGDLNGRVNKDTAMKVGRTVEVFTAAVVELRGKSLDF